MVQDNLIQTPKIPSALIWAQCITFAMLYTVWMIYELLYFRRILLVSGAILSIFPIYQYRTYFFQKRAIAVWLIVGLFLWAIFHLIFFSQDYPAQLMELRRIWKYAGLGAIFALGLGLSLGSANSSNITQRSNYWTLIYSGLSLPALIYLLKFFLTIYGGYFDITPPDFLRVNTNVNSAYYIPKTTYIAFCLPVLALSLGQVYGQLTSKSSVDFRRCLAIFVYLLIVATTLFLFDAQNTKNGIVYGVLFVILFLVILFFRISWIKFWLKVFFLVAMCFLLVSISFSHLQKNDSWNTIISDAQIGFRIDEYPQWKYAITQEYPLDKDGRRVSITNYERAAWFMAGLRLAVNRPLGYGLLEDSFKRMAEEKWPDAGSRLSHSHSGWLDLFLGIGFPGLILILGALLLNIRQSQSNANPWMAMIFWALTANIFLWLTTEVAATVSFSALIFWISWACGFTLIINPSNQRRSRNFG